MPCRTFRPLHLFLLVGTLNVLTAWLHAQDLARSEPTFYRGQMGPGVAATPAFGGYPAVGTGAAPIPYDYVPAAVEQPVLRTTSEAWSWQLLPASIIYKSYLAGVKESRLAGYLMGGDSGVNDDHLLWEGILGGRFGIIRYGNTDHITPQGFQLDVEASAQVRLDTNEEVDVQATDYRVGFPITYGIGAFQFKTGYYHLSSHLGDEFQIKRPTFTRLNYSRDVLLLGVGYNLHPDVRVYAEAGWAFYSDVAEPWEFQFGIDYAPGCPTGWHGAPFLAVNCHLRQEVNYGGNVTLQTGWAWRTCHGRLLRAGIHFYNGESNQFSFFDFHERFVGAAVWHDF